MTTPAAAGGLSSVAELPERVLHDCRGQTLARLPSGGSPATCWLVSTSRGMRVVKHHHHVEGTVDGHDLASFLRKPEQLRLIAHQRPALAPYVVPVCDVWAGPDWAAFSMPVVQGAGLGSLQHRPSLFTPAWTALLSVLRRTGWDEPVAPAPPSHVVDVHVNRVRRREWILRKHLPSGLLDGAVLVNGKLCPPLAVLLDQLAERSEILRPTGLYFPVHGDLNLGNIRVSSVGPTLLDPRGTLDPLDPVYDLAKALFSLTTFEALMAGGLESVCASDGTSVSVALRPGAASSAGSVAGYWTALEASGLARSLDVQDPGWRARLVVAHAVHHLAEAACRLSDPTAGRGRGPAAGPTRIRAAEGLLALGLWLGCRAVEVVDGQRDAHDHISDLAAMLRSGRS